MPQIPDTRFSKFLKVWKFKFLPALYFQNFGVLGSFVHQKPVYRSELIIMSHFQQKKFFWDFLICLGPPCGFCEKIENFDFSNFSPTSNKEVYTRKSRSIGGLFMGYTRFITIRTLFRLRQCQSEIPNFKPQNFGSRRPLSMILTIIRFVWVSRTSLNY